LNDILPCGFDSPHFPEEMEQSVEEIMIHQNVTTANSSEAHLRKVAQQMISAAESIGAELEHSVAIPVGDLPDFKGFEC
jgi:molybdenum-dependent DNA-binding transcriptional regulator ModE